MPTIWDKYWKETKFDEDYRGFENYKTSSFFVRMWLGFE